MVESLLAALITFTVTFLGLRALEWAYHRVRHTPDWSPHWGSWLFAVLLALYVFINNYGR
jgi:hypothetical protein